MNQEKYNHIIRDTTVTNIIDQACHKIYPSQSDLEKQKQLSCRSHLIEQLQSYQQQPLLQHTMEQVLTCLVSLPCKDMESCQKQFINRCIPTSDMNPSP